MSFGTVLPEPDTAVQEDTLSLFQIYGYWIQAGEIYLPHAGYDADKMQNTSKLNN